MRTLDLRDTYRETGSEPDRLEASLRWRCPELPRPLHLVWSENPVITLDRGTPWLYGPIEQDPLTTGDGRTVVPRRQRAQLRRFGSMRVPFQRLAIAHELDPDGPVASLLPTLRHGPRTCTDEVARAVVGPLPAHPGVARAVRVLDALVGGAVVTAAARAVETVLDPIIFGVVGPTEPEHGRICLWYPLAAWRW